MTILGFTGTQKGMTEEQQDRIADLLGKFHVTEAHHGDCIGADADFHAIGRYNGLWIIGHPPIKDDKRAFCDFDEELEPKEYLDRNKDIVDAADWLVATPGGFQEEIRSGTWSTVRYADRIAKPYVIVLPDGSRGKL